MRYILPLLMILATFTMCGGPEEVVKPPQSDDYFESVTTDFTGKSFKNPLDLKILKELDVCEFTSADSTYFATCSPENFKISPFKNSAKLEDAFILEMKAGIFPKNAEMPIPPIRHVIVFEREAGKLVKVGGFRGNLIGVRKNEKSGANDLLLALYDSDDETLFHCAFKWNGKKYEFHGIERLDYGSGFRTIKGDKKLETTQQIFQQLRDKSLIF